VRGKGLAERKRRADKLNANRRELISALQFGKEGEYNFVRNGRDVDESHERRGRKKRRRWGPKRERARPALTGKKDYRNLPRVRRTKEKEIKTTEEKMANDAAD